MYNENMYELIQRKNVPIHFEEVMKDLNRASF